MARTPYWAARLCWWSMSTLAILILSEYSSASSSSTGAIILHGPHHSAQKSTSTGAVDFNTSASKLSWVRLTIFGDAINNAWAMIKISIRKNARLLEHHESQPGRAANRGQTYHGGDDGQNFIHSAGGGRGGGGRWCALLLSDRLTLSD